MHCLVHLFGGDGQVPESAEQAVPNLDVLRDSASDVSLMVYTQA
jgi:hypothetical protein